MDWLSSLSENKANIQYKYIMAVGSQNKKGWLTVQTECWHYSSMNKSSQILLQLIFKRYYEPLAPWPPHFKSAFVWFWGSFKIADLCIYVLQVTIYSNKQLSLQTTT